MLKPLFVEELHKGMAIFAEQGLGVVRWCALRLFAFIPLVALSEFKQVPEWNPTTAGSKTVTKGRGSSALTLSLSACYETTGTYSDTGDWGKWWWKPNTDGSGGCTIVNFIDNFGNSYHRIPSSLGDGHYEGSDYHGKYYDVAGIGSKAAAFVKFKGELQFPKTLKCIHSQAFYHASVEMGDEPCPTLLDIPDSVTAIKNRAFAGFNMSELVLGEGIREIGYSAFQDCSQLSVVTFRGDCPDVDGAIYEGTPDSLTTYVDRSRSGWSDALAAGVWKGRPIVGYGSPPTCVWAFDPCGGTVSPTQWIFAVGERVGGLPVPTRDGYGFDGWYTMRAGGSVVTGESVVESALTLYAHWSVITYSITYELNGGNNASGNPVCYDVESEVSLLAPTRTGYVFVGWSPSSHVDKGTVGNLTFTADWAKICTLVLNPCGGTVEPVSKECVEGTRVGVLPVPKREGFEFAGWHMSAEGGDAVSSDRIATDDETYYARWIPIACTVTHDANGGQGKMSAQTFEYGIPQALAANGYVRDGYSFVGWSTNAMGEVVYLDCEQVVLRPQRQGERIALYAVWKQRPCPWQMETLADGTLKIVGVNSVSLKALVIPSQVNGSNVTEVGSWLCTGGKKNYYNLEAQSSITGIVISAGITKVDGEAFYGCGNLVSLSLPETLVDIGSSSFVSCVKLPEVRIPNSVTNIGEKAFYDCRQLWNVWMGSGLVHVGDQAFAGYEGGVDPGDSGAWPLVQREVHIADVGKWAGVHFDSWSANPITYVDGNHYNTALYLNDERVVDLVIPDGVETITDYAFHCVGGLNSISIPPSVRSVGVSAFSFQSRRTSDPGWNEVKISDLRKWAEIQFAGEYANPLKTAGRLVLNGEVVSRLDIPAGTTSIGDYAFCGCKELTSVALPASITSIGDYSFKGCDNLASVEMPSSVREIGANPFAGTSYWEHMPDGYVVMNDVLLEYKGEWGTCPETVVVPAGTRAIAANAFRWEQVKTVLFPESLVEIGENAFYNCPIGTLVMPPGIKRIGTGAFDGNQYGPSQNYKYGYLHNLIISNATDLIIEEKAFYGQPVTNVRISGTNITIGASAFASAQWNRAETTREWDGIVSLTGSGIVVGNFAFAGMRYKSVQLDITGVSRVGANAFEDMGCYWGWDSYSRSNDDSSIRFPFKLEFVGTNAFLNAYLRNVHFENHEMLFSEDLWLGLRAHSYRCYSIAVGADDEEIVDLAWPENQVKIPDYAFHAAWLRTIMVPASVREIGAKAFSYCEGLTNLVFLSDAPTVGERAFVYERLRKYKCALEVPKSAKGWDDDGDGKWQGFPLSCLCKLTTSVTNGCVRGGERGLYRETETVLLTAEANEGYVFSDWSGDVGGCTINGNTIGVPMDKDRHIEPRFSRVWTIAEALDAVSLAFTLGGDAPSWYVDDASGHDGVVSMRSGAIGDSQTNWIETVVSGPGTVSFWWKASGEYEVSKKGVVTMYDFAEFTIDGVSVAEIGADASWTAVAQTVEQVGTHTLRWMYHKDESGSDGEDCAWIDEIVWTPSAVPADPILDIGDNPTEAQIAEALAGSTDAKLAENITDGATYNAYRDWAVKVKGTNGTETAGAQTVKESSNAWVSFALGQDTLLKDAPTDEDLSIEAFEPAAEAGKFDFTVSLKDVEVGLEAAAENLKKVFGLEGGSSLQGMSSDNVDITFGTPEGGKVKFTAGPNAENADATTFFMKVGVK